MRKYLLAAVCAMAISSPAVAQDGWYAGVEGGVMKVKDLDLDYEDPAVDIDDGIRIDHKMGWDVDLIGGYDFGMFRLEAEIGYKKAKLDELEIESNFINDLDDALNLGADPDFP